MGRVSQFAYQAQRAVWRLLRPRTRGVKVMLFNGDGEILLIRNSYGTRHLFVLPGGGVRPWETPARAAHREVSEELGCSLETLTPVSTHLTSAEGKRDTVYLFEGRLAGTPRADGVEVAEAGYFALDALPGAVSPATARRLSERSGDAAPDGSW
jgi:ADP-ribose pyrophosphatase YjhB (NUDIX family)